jgi:hypothetical protein
MASGDPGFEWHEIADHALVLQGLADTEPASLTFCANAVLSTADSIHDPAAVGFNAELILPTNHSASPLTYQHTFGCYSCLWSFRDRVAEVRDGKNREAQLDGADGLALSIIEHTRGGVFVCGCFRDPPHIRTWHETPTAAAEALIKTHDYQGHCINFAFQTSSIDPPLLNNFIRDLDSLLSHIESFRT